MLTIYFKNLLWLEVLRWILLERYAPAAEWVMNQGRLLELGKFSVHHTWIGYKTSFHIESEISDLFPFGSSQKKRVFIFLLPYGRCWRWRGIHLLLHFSLFMPPACVGLYKELITVFKNFTKKKKKKKSMHETDPLLCLCLILGLEHNLVLH